MLKSQTKIVLCATSKNMQAGVWVAGKFTGDQHFENEAQGYASFAGFLQQHLNAPVYLLVDAVEEDYKLESIPHTSGGAQKELIERKLNQFYRNTPFKAAQFISRETDKRKDDRFLFSALTNTEFLDPWLEAMQSIEAMLAGVYLLPMLSQTIVREHKLMQPHILLCEKLTSGLRQTYLHNGRVRMSRLVPDFPNTKNQLKFFYLTEIEKTRLYLISQRLITRDVPLSLVITSYDGQTTHLSEDISQEHGLEATHLNLSDFAKELHLPLGIAQLMPELLHMQLLVNGTQADNLAPSKFTHIYAFNQLQKMLGVVSILLGVFGLIAMSWLFIQGLSFRSDSHQLAQDTQLMQRRYDDEAKSFPTTAISAQDLKNVVEINQAIRAMPKSPRRMMQVLSETIEKVPEVRLLRMRWLYTKDYNVSDEDALIQVTANANTPTEAAPTLDANQLYEMALVTAEIADFNGDYRTAFNLASRVAVLLRSDARVLHVQMMQAPVNVSSYANIQGNTADSQMTKTSSLATFKIKVLLKKAEAVNGGGA